MGFGLDTDSIRNIAHDAFNSSGSTKTSTGNKNITPVKPLFGKFFDKGRITTNAENSRLADILGKDNASNVKAGIVAGGMIGGLYLAYQFFRPNQMSMLGEMPGTGGEAWGPIRGSAMELPRNVSIGTDSYQSDPRSKVARVTPIDPILMDKMYEYRQNIREGVLSNLVKPYSSNYNPSTSGGVNRFNRY
jgi:hypothetical protein